MKAGWTISAVGHAALLAWGLISIAARPLNATPPESLPVDIISATDFSQITNGIKTAPKAEAPKPLVEKIAEAKPVEEANAKVVNKKPEIAATSDKVEPPKPQVEQKKPEPPKPPTPAQKSEPKQAFAKEPEPKVDPIAEALKKDTKKPDPKTQQKAETPLPQKKPEPPKPQPKFDASRIAALLDKRDPQRHSATGDTLSHTPSLGTPTGRSASLTQSEIDALRARIQQCWNPPAGLADARDLVVVVRIRFNQDGSLSADPTLSNSGSHPTFQVAAESALRAVRRCAPYSFMPIAKYDVWKDVEVTFDPRDMFRG
jgi:outer membrane biosynthesis protein TonB